MSRNLHDSDFVVQLTADADKLREAFEAEAYAEFNRKNRRMLDIERKRAEADRQDMLDIERFESEML